MPKKEDEVITIQKSSHNIKAIIDYKAFEKVEGIAKALGSNEGSGYMWCTWPDDTTLRIHHVSLIKGVASSSYTEMDRDANRRFMLGLWRHGVLSEDSKWKLYYYHYHTTFGVFQSGTDSAMHEEISADSEIYPTMVVNNKWEFVLPTIIRKGGIKILLDTLPLEVNKDSKEVSTRDYSAEVKRKVSPMVYHQVSTNSEWTGLENYTRGWEYGRAMAPEISAYPGETDILSRAFWKLENDIPLMWWEQEMVDEENQKRLYETIPVADDTDQLLLGVGSSKADESVSRASAFFNYAGTIFRKKGKN